MTIQQQEVITRIRALRELEKATGLITKRTQSKILQRLSEADLEEIALFLSQESATRNEVSSPR